MAGVADDSHEISQRNIEIVIRSYPELSNFHGAAQVSHRATKQGTKPSPTPICMPGYIKQNKANKKPSMLRMNRLALHFPNLGSI